LVREARKKGQAEASLRVYGGESERERRQDVRDRVENATGREAEAQVIHPVRQSRRRVGGQKVQDFPETEERRGRQRHVLFLDPSRRVQGLAGFTGGEQT